MILIDRDPNIGDTICALPLIETLWNFDEKSSEGDPRWHFIFENREVPKLFPAHLQPYIGLDSIPDGVNASITIGAWKAVQAFGWGDHPIRQLARLCFKLIGELNGTGYQEPLAVESVPRPELTISDEAKAAAPYFDILLAPWSKDNWRALEVNEVAALLPKLEQRGTVAVLGGPDDPLAGATWAPELQYGRPLDVVLAMMQKAKCVITTDSACNRLAHAAGISTHVLLASTNGPTPDAWMGHPGVHFVHGQWRNWRLSSILDAVDRILSGVPTHA